jgi:hypothetical protein
VVFGGKTEPVNFAVSSRTVLLLSDSEFISIAPSSKIIFKIRHNFSNPLMKKGNWKTLIFDLGGKNFKIVTKSKLIESGETEQKIIAASISERETYGFLTESDEYYSEMAVFGANKEKKYKYYFAKFHAIDIAIGKNGDSAAVCGIAAVDNEIRSVIYIFDFKSKTPKFTYEFKNNIITSIDCFSNGTFAAIGEKAAMFVNKKGEIKEFNYNSKQICLTSLDKSFGIAISLSSTFDERVQQIAVLNKKGKLISNIETDKKLKSIELMGDRICVLSENQISVYGAGGKLRRQTKVPVASKKAGTISDSKAVLLGDGEIDLIKLDLS